ncbi:MAG: hypothetical protein JW942_02650 [Opitutales bacterium]|nr:hypothetical protein [Opitutales bacterium]
MIDRLYDNGMLTSGEARHYNCWEYPTMPRLRNPQPVVQARRQPVRNMSTRKRGYVAILFDVLRAR